jgi:photosystem II stability/assembly factor-like uncharacterized protein
MPRFPFRRSFAVLSLMLLPIVAHAQGFQAATTKDGTDVWAAGDGGRLWRSLNSGAAWAPRQLGASPLRGVAHRGLVVLVVGDSGQVYHSADNGGTFALLTVPGLPALRAVAMPAAGRAYVAGDAGTLLRSDDDGATWTPQVSGTASALYALAFTDADHGWAAGAGGTLLQTSNGGANWDPVASGTANALYSVAQSGNSVWAVGAEGTCLVSTDGGGVFAPYNLRADNQPDVRAVALASPSDVWVAGGGGFVRRSQDGGATWSFPTTTVHGQVSALALGGGQVIAVSSRFLAPAKWDGANAFTLPAGATLTRSWSLRQSAGAGTIRGNTMSIHPRNKHVYYTLIGPSLYRSGDDGETWAVAKTVTGVNRANAFVISPKDTAVMIAAIVTTGGARQIRRTSNGGTSWTTVLTPPNGWGEYGIPLEIHPDKPDTLLMGADNSLLYRSTDGGITWGTFGSKVFRSPCDIIITPDNESNVLVGDGITGSGIGDLWQSADSGLTFVQRELALGSEIPGMSMGRLNNKVAFATTWSSAGVRVTSDGGKSWPLVADLNRSGQNVSSSWGTAVGHDDANVVLVGQYSGSQTYISTNGGGTFSPNSLSGSNYSLDIRDRETMLAQQSGGVYKMRFTYAYTPSSGTQTVQVTAPNGGESWNASSVHAVTWNAANVALARIEWRSGPADSWHLVADVEGYAGTYAWTLPDVATTTAEVRVSDAWDVNPSDASNAVFSIVQPATLSLLAPAGGEAWKVGTTHTLSWSSTAIDSVVLAFRTSPDSAWTSIATVPALPATYDWIVPLAPTSTARLRVRDPGGAHESVTPADFAITVPLWYVDAPQLELLSAALGQGSYGTFTVADTGTAGMSVSNVTSDNPRFTVFRTAFDVNAGAQDSLGVLFTPVADGPDSALITVVADDPDSPHVLRVHGQVQSTTDAGPRPAGLPHAFALAQPSPNPFLGSAAATVRFDVPVRSRLKLEVYDVQGHRVATLLDDAVEPGRYAIPFGSGSGLAGGGRMGRVSAGVYFVRLRAPGFSATRRVMVLH